MPQHDVTYLSKKAYKAYGDRAQWKNHLGKPMPQWDDLPFAIQENWDAVTLFFIKELSK